MLNKLEFIFIISVVSVFNINCMPHIDILNSTKGNICFSYIDLKYDISLITKQKAEVEYFELPSGKKVMLWEKFVDLNVQMAGEGTTIRKIEVSFQKEINFHDGLFYYYIFNYVFSL